MRRKFLIGLGAFFVLLIIVGIIAVATDSGDGTPEPKDVLPTAVSGFNLVRVTPQRAESSEAVGQVEVATAYFEPSYGSPYRGKVEELVVEVTRYKDEAACSIPYDYLVGFYEKSTVAEAQEIWVDGVAILTYFEDERYGEASAYAQRGRLLLFSDALSPLDATDIVDEQLLKDAATAGLKAVQSMLSSQ